MSVLGGKWTFMIKILVRAREYRSTTNFPEIPLCRPFIGLQSQKCFFALFFDREYQSKKYFCITNLVQWQVYRVEKVGIYLHSLEKKSIFSFLHIPILGYTFELLFTNGVMSDREAVIFFEFSIVELTILR